MVDKSRFTDVSQNMVFNNPLSVLNILVRHKIPSLLQKRLKFQPARPEHNDIAGVVPAHINEKVDIDLWSISLYVAQFKPAEFFVSKNHGQQTFYRRDKVAPRTFLNDLANGLYYK